MAGGAGGAGGTNGAAGAAGGTGNDAAGGAGGVNPTVVIDGSERFGPYGQGGKGADSYYRAGDSGAPGAVVITWGGGVSGTARSA